MHFETLIQNGTLVSSSDTHQGDIGIIGGKIAAVGNLSGADADEIIDAAGLTVIPGIIDTQVHFREPGATHKEDIESGTRSAVFGGVTSIFEMPNTNPTTTNPEALEQKLGIAAETAWCNYSFFVGATPDNADMLAEYENLPGTPGIKIFAGSSTGSLLMSEQEDLRRAFSHGKRRVAIHSEDEARNRSMREQMEAQLNHARQHPEVRDAESARISTERILRVSKETHRPVHILHLSTKDEIPMIAEAKKAGLNTTVEITPQHLYFQAPDCYEKLGTLAQMNPPVRTKEHNEALWKAFQSGFFDVMGSDHAPHTLEEKQKPYPSSPSGMPGVQTILQVMLTFAQQGKISINEIVRMGCEGPAQIYGIKGKGYLKEGYDADICLVDPQTKVVFERSMVQSKCDWSPYEGETLCAAPLYVLVNGNVVIREGALASQVRHARMVEFDWKSE